MMTDPVIVTVAPTGTSPVQTAPVVPTDKVPELAAWLPALLIWAAVLEVVKPTLIPRYGVCPVLMIVVVSLIVVPGVAVAGLNAELIVSAETVTAVVQRGSVLPARQLLPVLVEVTVLARILLPVSGVCTVTE